MRLPSRITAALLKCISKYNNHTLAEIHFFQEETSFQLDNAVKVSRWLEKIAAKEGKNINTLNYIFCSDEYLYHINVEYLDHHTYTDIITFPYEENDDLESDIFISIDRVKENALQYKISFEQELYRVMAHGLLHLCGYGDKTPTEKITMRAKEEEYLAYIISP